MLTLFKNIPIEHALCEFDKYFRLALGVPFKDREYSEQKSRSHLDSKSQCGLCSKDAKEECVKCLFCGILYHKSCETDWGQKYHQDGSWLCDVCHEIGKEHAFEKYDQFTLNTSCFHGRIQYFNFTNFDKFREIRIEKELVLSQLLNILHFPYRESLEPGRF